MSGTLFGQISKETTCSKTLPCDVLDFAQAKIEKGAICEVQRTNDSIIILNQKVIIAKLEQTIEDISVISNRKDAQITTLEDKVKKRGRQRFSWSGISLLLGRVSKFFF